MSAEHSPTTGPARSLELLWGSRERPSRGPRPGLSVDRIVRTAIEVADAEGLDGLSMQRVAGELGYTTMSLYRYVSAKDQLIDVMMDTAVGEPPTVEGEGLGWRAELELWARRAWGVYQRHPWMLRVEVSGPPAGPNQLAWMECALRALSGTGLTGAEMLSTLVFLDGAVRELARIAVTLEREQQRSGVTEDQMGRMYGRILAEYADAGRYPTLAGLVASGVFDPPEAPGDEPADEPGDELAGDIGTDVSFGVQRLLDGVEAHVRSRSARP